MTVGATGLPGEAAPEPVIEPRIEPATERSVDGPTSAGRDLKAAVAAATATLAAAAVPSPRADATALAAHVLAIDPAELHKRLILGATLTAELADRYEQLVATRATRVPLQHLTGRAAFRSLELTVGPGTFVPRPETETLVDLALAALDGGAPAADATLLAAPAIVDPAVPVRGATATATASAPKLVVDLCTGSGAIALAIATERPGTRVVAVERSEIAVRTARHNAARLAPSVQVVHADATADPATVPHLAPLLGRVDVVVSNPPYIPPGMLPIDPEVADHDPPMALYGGGADGLAIPLAVAATAHRLLAPGGLLVMEHADAQGESLPAALRATGQWDDVHDHADLAGRPRHTSARSRTATTARLKP